MGLLEEKTSVEDFVEWGQSVLHTTVKVQCYRVLNNNVYSMVHCGRIMYTLAPLDHALNI